MSQDTIERVWRTHSNRAISISDMIDDHLLNSIYMIDKGKTVKGEPLKPGQAEMYDELVNEAKSRNLEIDETVGWDL